MQVVKFKDDRLENYEHLKKDHLDSYEKAKQLVVLSNSERDQYKTSSCLVGQAKNQIYWRFTRSSGHYATRHSCFKTGQRKFSRVLNANLYSFRNGCRANILGVHAMSKKTGSRGIKNIAHVTSLTRQDSNVLDISLHDSNEELSKHMNQERTSRLKIHAGRPGVIVVPHQNNKTDQQHSRQLLVHTPLATSPYSKQYRQGLLIKPTSMEQNTQDSTSLYFKDDTWKQLHSGSAQDQVDKVRQCVTADSINNASRFEKNFDKDYSSLYKTKRRSNVEFGQTSGRLSARQLERLLCIVTTALIILGVVVMMLFLRVQTIERGYNVLLMTRCRCDQEKSARLDKDLDEAVHMKSSLEDKNSSKIKTRMDETDGDKLFNITNMNLEEQKTLLSRHVRSSNKRPTFKDKKLSRCYNKAKSERATRDCKSNIETFEGYIYNHFSFQRDFGEKESATLEQWGPDIVAFRNATIFIRNQYTALPFYVETNKTAHKVQNKKLVQTSNVGIFYVQKHGSYLIHINITIVDLTGKHSLALLLNGLAMFTCPGGGFRCPHSNQEDVTKYKICNIVGVLELNINDTLEIRTMEPNMWVRLEGHRRSHFNIVRLK